MLSGLASVQLKKTPGVGTATNFSGKIDSPLLSSSKATITLSDGGDPLVGILDVKLKKTSFTKVDVSIGGARNEALAALQTLKKRTSLDAVVCVRQEMADKPSIPPKLMQAPFSTSSSIGHPHVKLDNSALCLVDSGEKTILSNANDCISVNMSHISAHILGMAKAPGIENGILEKHGDDEDDEGAFGFDFEQSKYIYILITNT